MLVQACHLFRRSIYMHVRDAPGFHCYKYPSDSPKEKWVEAILEVSKYVKPTTDSHSRECKPPKNDSECENKNCV